MRRKILIILVLLMVIVAGCSNDKVDETAHVDSEGSKAYYSFTDSLGNSVMLQEKPQRVVSLVGSYAQTWMLAGGEVIGVTDDVISEGRFEISEEISIVGTVKEPNVEEVLSLSPDFVLLSPDIENHLKIRQILEDAAIPHAYFKVEYFEDYLKMLDICTDITGNKDLYEEHGLKIKEEIDGILSRIEDAGLDHKPTVLFVRAFSSGAKAKKDDNLTCKMLEDLGTVNIASKYPSLLEELSIEEIIQEDPDYIFVTTMGSTEKAIEALRNGIEKNPAWNSLTAVKNDRYIILPKELFHYKPNAKWGESYRYLAEIIYPEIFN
ncbi:MAG: ABC transporter substrate-binding protein [Tepidanaerobacteraceae bacterium]|nr:ABC transporter substrate-binding protein [Tepidanaerobacteraceae bacterium]HQE06153.1 ABC transporter substrate-binding protein [Tepidanaerobacteraceae bacterium]